MLDKPIDEADYIPAPAALPVVVYGPIILPARRRRVDLRLQISAPVSGSALPIILLSHGHGPSTYLSSSRGYAPLASFYSARGFIVIQPTHQDAKALGLDPDGPEGALFWRSRAEDMHYILDQLDQIEAETPGLSGRIDRSRICAVGHSLGGHTVGMLAGMRVSDLGEGRSSVGLRDSRVKAAVLLAPPGKGADLAAFAAENYPILKHTDFETMTTPALVVAGDKDFNARFSDREDWRADAYHLSPGPKCLLTLFGAEHSLGGVSGYDVAETTDQDPERLGCIQRLSWAYLRTALYPEDPAWRDACDALSDHNAPLGRVDCR